MPLRWSETGESVSLESFLVVSAIIFSIGMYGALSRRNAITVLMSLELMFNAVNLSAVAMSRYIVPASLVREAQTAVTRDIEDTVQMVLTGQIFAVFVITVAAAEIALGLAIVIAIYRTRDSIFVTDADLMRN